MTTNQKHVLIGDDDWAELMAIKEATGAPVSEQIRRAVKDWIAKQKEKKA